MADDKVGEVFLKNVRLSFADIFTAKSVNGGEARFSANFLLDPETKSGSANIAKCEKAIEDAIEKKWPGKSIRLKEAKKAMRSGDDEDWEGYAGMMYVSAANKKRPVLIDRQRQPVAEEDDILYSGCYVNAIVRFYAHEREDSGKRVNASLEAVQYVGKGERFGGGTPIDVNEAFEDLGEEDDDEDEAPRSRRRSRSRDEDDDDELV